MTNVITPTREYQRLRIQLKVDPNSYRNAWLNLEKIGRKIDRLWKTKKKSFEILKEERQ